MTTTREEGGVGVLMKRKALNGRLCAAKNKQKTTKQYKNRRGTGRRGGVERTKSVFFSFVF